MHFVAPLRFLKQFNCNPHTSYFPINKLSIQLSQQSQLAEGFFHQLNDVKEDLPQQLHQLLEMANLEENSRSESLASMIEDLNPSAILGHAQQLGLNWFSELTSTEKHE